MIAEDRTLATSSDLDKMIKLISQYYYGSTISLQQISSNPEKYDVYNKKGKIDQVYVIKNKGRYKFIDPIL